MFVLLFLPISSMQDNSELLWHGVLFGLFLIAAFGVFLFGRRKRMRAALAPYVGDEPARWLLYLMAFGYAYGVLNAIGQAATTVPMFAPEMGLPPVLAFGQGAAWYAGLSFLNGAVAVAQIGALLLAVLVLYRHLDRRPA